MRLALICIWAVFLSSCMESATDSITVQGHRGWRGKYPENTLPAFKAACELGVTTLELDVVVSADHEILVSHDPFLHHEICVHPDGSLIAPAEAGALNIYRMRADSVRQYPCGALPHPRFPDQQSIPTHKPTLGEVFTEVVRHCDSLGIRVPGFNIEAKSRPEWYGDFQPEPALFAKMLADLIRSSGLADKITLQSFDPEMLRQLHFAYPESKLFALNENPELSMDRFFDELGFTPYGYSPEHVLVDKTLVRSCKDGGIELAVWTVNEAEDIERMLGLGVTNLITDYPERALELINQRGAKIR